MTGKPRILSGMRPTGALHLGHLVGALRNWSALQERYDCFFMVADWHAFMSEYQDARRIPESSLDNVIDWLSCGIDPERSTLFVQSQVPEHLELSLIFACLTPLGMLERCPTYKEQLRELTTREINTYAFLGYPVLQAADILMYKAAVVPVGEDQLPHLELTREIARRFNNLVKRSVFPEPDAELTPASRLMGTDGRKMSKSYGNFISLSDAPAMVRKKVMSMFTDPQRIHKTDPGDAERCNVYRYYQIFAPSEISANIPGQCCAAQIGCTDCKQQLAGILIALLEPIQAARRQWEAAPERVREILARGQAVAQQAARQTMQEVKPLVGL